MTQVEQIHNEILIIRALTSNARVWRRTQTGGQNRGVAEQ